MKRRATEALPSHATDYKVKERKYKISGQRGSNDFYVYTPLPRYSIRVFHLEPAVSLTDPLIVRFEIVPLRYRRDGNSQASTSMALATAPPSRDPGHSEVDYIALSYAWITSQLTEMVHCDGHPIRITASLHGALVRIREQLDLGTLASRRSLRPALWADGLCIDQSNTVERNHQVQYMLQVYKGCCRLLIWLGEPVRHTISWVDETWTADLIRVPWLKRRWVVQEYLAAKGKQRDFLLGAAMRNDQSVVRTLRIADLLRNAGPLSDQVTDARATTLVCQLYIHQAAMCQDARDCVYALLGISVDADLVKVDYTQSVEDLYIILAAHYVRKASQDWVSFYVLMGGAVMRKRKRGSANHVLPSWVPDWRGIQPVPDPTSRVADLNTLGLSDTAGPYMHVMMESTLSCEYCLNDVEPHLAMVRGTRLSIVGHLLDAQALDDWADSEWHDLLSCSVSTGPDSIAHHGLLNLAEALRVDGDYVFIPGHSFITGQSSCDHQDHYFPAFILRSQRTFEEEDSSGGRATFVLEDCAVIKAEWKIDISDCGPLSQILIL